MLYSPYTVTASEHCCTRSTLCYTPSTQLHYLNTAPLLAHCAALPIFCAALPVYSAALYVHSYGPCSLLHSLDAVLHSPYNVLHSVYIDTVLEHYCTSGILCCTPTQLQYLNTVPLVAHFAAHPCTLCCLLCTLTSPDLYCKTCKLCCTPCAHLQSLSTAANLVYSASLPLHFYSSEHCCTSCTRCYTP